MEVLIHNPFNSTAKAMLFVFNAERAHEPRATSPTTLERVIVRTFRPVGGSLDVSADLQGGFAIRPVAFGVWRSLRSF